jgi:hypothetical protein
MGGWTMPIALIVASSRASAWGLDFERRALSGFSFSGARIDEFQFHCTSSVGIRPAASAGLLRLLSEDTLRPAGGRDGATAGEHPCPAGARGAQRALRERRGRDRETVG